MGISATRRTTKTFKKHEENKITQKYQKIKMHTPDNHSPYKPGLVPFLSRSLPASATGSTLKMQQINPKNIQAVERHRARRIVKTAAACRS